MTKTETPIDFTNRRFMRFATYFTPVDEVERYSVEEDINVHSELRRRKIERRMLLKNKNDTPNAKLSAQRWIWFTPSEKLHLVYII